MDRGNRVARGQSDDPLQARVEEHVAGNRKRAGPMLHERRKRGIQFGVVAGFDHQDLLPDRARRSLHCRAGKLGTTSASPSIMVWMASMASSICSSVISLTPPECSNFISRGT